MILHRFFGWSRLELLCTLFLVSMLFGASLPVTATEDLSEAEARLRSGDVLGALSLFKLAATNGNLAAQNRLGLLYFNGVSVTKDPDLAFSWFKKAADAGDTNSQFMLASLFLNGTGRVRDSAAAVQYFELAAKQGDVDAQAMLGTLYYESSGALRDYNLAVKWPFYRKIIIS